MIKVNGEVVEDKRFPDGTFSFKLGDLSTHIRFVNIEWLFESPSETVMLWHITQQLHAKGFDSINLDMPYVPNARMDRVKNYDDVFTLKSFARLINLMDFSRVYVLDPHSDVTPALIDKVAVVYPKRIIDSVVSEMNSENLFVVFPDDGAKKRYVGMFPDIPFGVGHKVRDWKTGEITDFKIEYPCGMPGPGNDVLIVDDICSRGGTIKAVANAVRVTQPDSIGAFVTHCENTIMEGDLIKNHLVDRVFTTNSLFSLNVPEITVLDWRLAF